MDLVRTWFDLSLCALCIHQLWFQFWVLSFQLLSLMRLFSVYFYWISVKYRLILYREHCRWSDNMSFWDRLHCFYCMYCDFVSTNCLFYKWNVIKTPHRGTEYTVNCKERNWHDKLVIKNCQSYVWSWFCVSSVFKGLFLSWMVSNLSSIFQSERVYNFWNDIADCSSMCFPAWYDCMSSVDLND